MATELLLHMYEVVTNLEGVVDANTAGEVASSCSAPSTGSDDIKEVIEDLSNDTHCLFGLAPLFARPAYDPGTTVPRPKVTKESVAVSSNGSEKSTREVGDDLAEEQPTESPKTAAVDSGLSRDGGGIVKSDSATALSALPRSLPWRGIPEKPKGKARGSKKSAIAGADTEATSALDCASSATSETASYFSRRSDTFSLVTQPTTADSGFETEDSVFGQDIGDFLELWISRACCPPAGPGSSRGPLTQDSIIPTDMDHKTEFLSTVRKVTTTEAIVALISLNYGVSSITAELLGALGFFVIKCKLKAALNPLGGFFRAIGVCRLLVELNTEDCTRKKYINMLVLSDPIRENVGLILGKPDIELLMPDSVSRISSSLDDPQLRIRSWLTEVAASGIELKGDQIPSEGTDFRGDSGSKPAARGSDSQSKEGQFKVDKDQQAPLHRRKGKKVSR
ncbi:hypothetical protein OQA88_13200 [Cercophora sp. LCS_1]